MKRITNNRGLAYQAGLEWEECLDLQPDLDNANVGKEMRKC